MNTRITTIVTLACAAAALLSTPALGQVVRETGTNSLAGLLDAYWNPADSFTFQSKGGEVLFADVDAEIFQVKGRKGGSHDDEEDCGGSGGGHDSGAVVTAAVDDHEDHDDAGGPGGMCLQVINSAGTMICWADRPARPGWQRDPAIACPLPDSGRPAQYQLRVSLKSGGCGPGKAGGHDAAVMAAPSDGVVTPYVLNWSLRRVAEDGALRNQSELGTP
ncbi:MAG: hypothetical protein ACNA8G_12385 [Gammaproteobacteria bacterium]